MDFVARARDGLTRRWAARVCLWLGIAFGYGTAGADAQTPILEIGSATAFPGDTGVEVPVILSSNEEVSAIDLRVIFDDSHAELEGVELDGGVLQDVEFELAEVDFVPGASEVEIHWVLDSTSPFTNVLSAGSGLVLATLSFEVSTFLLPGAESAIELADGLGEDEKNLVYVAGEAVEPLLLDGILRIADENVFLTEDGRVRRTATDRRISLDGFNVEGVQGYSIALSYDATVFDVSEVVVEDPTIEKVGAEFIETNVDEALGEVIVGVLLDVVPPFDNQELPAAGFVYELAALICDVRENAPLGITELRFENGIGSPPTDNLFVIDFFSEEPALRNAEIEIREAPIFVRGDVTDDGIVNIQDPILELSILFLGFDMPDCQKPFDGNDDGLVNLADPVYVLAFLFTQGPPPPEPFPDEGLDPTPDSVPCD